MALTLKGVPNTLTQDFGLEDQVIQLVDKSDDYSAGLAELCLHEGDRIAKQVQDHIKSNTRNPDGSLYDTIFKYLIRLYTKTWILRRGLVTIDRERIPSDAAPAE